MPLLALAVGCSGDGEAAMTSGYDFEPEAGCTSGIFDASFSHGNDFDSTAPDEYRHRSTLSVASIEEGTYTWRVDIDVETLSPEFKPWRRATMKGLVAAPPKVWGPPPPPM